MAKSYKNSGFESTFAPESINKQKPPAIQGISEPIAGLSIPLILPTRRVPPLNNAPVLPADTIASALPSLTAYKALTIEESFLRLIAKTGLSSFDIMSSALMSSILLKFDVFFSNILLISISFPESIIPRLYSSLACILPIITASGALSPPMASIAIFIFTSILYTYISI